MQIIMDDEYASMRWNLRTAKGLACVAFPELNERFLDFQKEKFEAPLTFDNIVRYIVFCYHKDSPLVKKRIDIKVRKDRALAEAGFHLDKEWAPEIRAVIKNDNEVVLKMILQFLKFERNMRYANLMMLYERYWSLSLASVEFKTSVKDSKDTQDLLALIETEEDLVFSGDKDLGDHVSALLVVEKRYLITPEQHAGKIKNDRKETKQRPTADRHKETLAMLRAKD